MSIHTPFRLRLKEDWWAAAAEVDQWKVNSTDTEDFKRRCEEQGVSMSTAYALLTLKKRFLEKPQGSSWRKLL